VSLSDVHPAGEQESAKILLTADDVLGHQIEIAAWRACLFVIAFLSSRPILSSLASPGKTVDPDSMHDYT
jgi:hypothetical protein